MFQDLVIFHIYLNPNAGLQSPDLGMRRTLSEDVRNKLLTISDINQPLLSASATERANVIQTHLKELFTASNEKTAELRSILLKMSEFSSSVPDLEENGYMYSLNLMLIALTNDLRLYTNKDTKTLGANLLNVVRSYDYMVCIANKQKQSCSVYIVPGRHPSGQVIRKILQSPAIFVPAKTFAEAEYRLKIATYLVHQIAGTKDAAGTLDDEIIWYIDTL